MKSIYGKAIFIFICGTLLITGNELLDIESIIGYVMIIISFVLMISKCVRKKNDQQFEFN